MTPGPAVPGSGAPDPVAVAEAGVPVRRILVRVVALVALGAGLGALSGLLWHAAVDLPAYRIGSEGGASITERGLAAFIGGDAWFCGIGAVVGLLLGTLAWFGFRRVGWPVVPVAVLAATVAALVCQAVGTRLGPSDFTRRLAAAQPGELVPISLELRAWTSLLVWPFLAVVPVLLGSSLGADEKEAARAGEPTSAGDDG